MMIDPKGAALVAVGVVLVGLTIYGLLRAVVG